MTLNGSAYFLSSSVLIKIELAPEYSISAILSKAAAECNMGIEFLASTLPIIIASRNVQFRDSHNGSKTPLKKAAGLNKALRIALN
jgi:hypothetical protein